MKKLACFIVVLYCIFSSGACSSNSEILATFKGGEVKRAELRSFYSMRNITPDPQNSTIQNQMKVVNDIGFNKLVVLENQKSKLVSEKDYNDIISIVEPHFIFNQYRLDFIKEKVANKSMEFAIARMMLVKPSNQSFPISENTTQNLASSVTQPEDTKARADKYLKEISLIKSEKEEIDYIQKHTDDKQRVALGGLMEPTCINCGKDFFSDILTKASLNKGKYIQQEANGNYYIVKVEEVVPIYPKNIKKFLNKKFEIMKELATNYSKKKDISEEERKVTNYYKDLKVESRVEQTASHLEKRFSEEMWNQEIELIKKAKEIKISEINPDFIKNISSETVLVTIGKNQSLRFNDLSNEYDKLSIIIAKDTNLSEDQIIQDKIGFFNQIYVPIILSKEAKLEEKININQNSIELFKNSILWLLIRKKMSDEEIQVSEEEIKSAYEAGKLYAYSSPNPKNPAERIAKSYSEVKNNVKKDLIDSKSREKIENYVKEIQKKYNFIIDRNKLKNGYI